MHACNACNACKEREGGGREREGEEGKGKEKEVCIRYIIKSNKSKRCLCLVVLSPPFNLSWQQQEEEEEAEDSWT